MATERHCLSTFASNRSKGGECEKLASLLNLEFNMVEETHFHILNKMIKIN